MGFTLLPENLYVKGFGSLDASFAVISIIFDYFVVSTCLSLAFLRCDHGNSYFNLLRRGEEKNHLFCTKP